VGADRKIADLAARQHGVLARSQLKSLGLGKGAIDHRLMCRRLHPVRPGVYAVGHTLLTKRGHLMAAVLACGPESLVSHRAAGDLHEIHRWEAGRIDIIGSRTRRGGPGLRLHRVREMHPDDRTVIGGIPVTSLPKTLLGLAEDLPLRRVERAFEQAERLRILDVRAVQALIQRSGGFRGVAVLRAVVAAAYELPDTQSELEHRFAALCRRYRLPLPALNVAIGPYVVDALWAAQRLIVELDGYDSHGHRWAFEGDRIRDASLQLSGYRVLRITWKRLNHEPAAVARMIRAGLSMAGAGHPPALAVVA
jgi:very-short-patch-repair endonuclease